MVCRVSPSLVQYLLEEVSNSFCIVATEVTLWLRVNLHNFYELLRHYEGPITSPLCGGSLLEHRLCPDHLCSS